MKWSKSELFNSPNGIISFDERIAFEPNIFVKMDHLRGLQDVEVSGKIRYESQTDFAICEFEVSGVMIVACCITNEDVEYPFTTNATQVFAFHKVSKEEDIIEAKKDIVELMPVIFQHISFEIPLKVVKPGLKEYPKGKGWEVVKEEDYINSKKNEIDPRLAKLREFKIEEDK